MVSEAVLGGLQAAGILPQAQKEPDGSNATPAAAVQGSVAQVWPQPMSFAHLNNKKEFVHMSERKESNEILSPSTQQDEIQKNIFISTNMQNRKKNWGWKHFLFRQPEFFKCWPLSRYPPSLLALKDCLNNSLVFPLKCHVALLLPNQS